VQEKLSERHDGIHWQSIWFLWRTIQTLIWKIKEPWKMMYAIRAKRRVFSNKRICQTKLQFHSIHVKIDMCIFFTTLHYFDVFLAQSKSHYLIIYHWFTDAFLSLIFHLTLAKICHFSLLVRRRGKEAGQQHRCVYEYRHGCLAKKVHEASLRGTGIQIPQFSKWHTFSMAPSDMRFYVRRNQQWLDHLSQLKFVLLVI